MPVGNTAMPFRLCKSTFTFANLKSTILSLYKTTFLNCFFFFILLEKCVFCILPARQKTVIIIKNLQKNYLVLHHVCVYVCFKI